MGKRLRVKHKKTSRDLSRLAKTGVIPNQHKVALRRSRKARNKKLNRMT